MRLTLLPSDETKPRSPMCIHMQKDHMLISFVVMSLKKKKKVFVLGGCGNR